MLLFVLLPARNRLQSPGVAVQVFESGVFGAAQVLDFAQVHLLFIKGFGAVNIDHWHGDELQLQAHKSQVLAGWLMIVSTPQLGSGSCLS